MARRTARPQPPREPELPALTRTCPACGRPLWAADRNHRTVTALEGVLRLGVRIRRCRDRACRQHGLPVRPEQEGRFVLPERESGLDVIALVGQLRHAEHRSVPEIHAELVRRGVPICTRSVGNLLDRHDELLALSTADVERLRRITAAAGRSPWPSTVSSPTSGTRSSGSCATSSASRSCWPAWRSIRARRGGDWAKPC